MDILGIGGFGFVYSMRLDGTLPFGPFYMGPVYDLVCADIDGDGGPEIVIASEQLHIYKLGAGLIASTDYADYLNFKGVTVGDVNGDGIQEVAALSYYPDGAGFALHLMDASLRELRGLAEALRTSHALLFSLERDGRCRRGRRHGDHEFLWTGASCMGPTEPERKIDVGGVADDRSRLAVFLLLPPGRPAQAYVHSRRHQWKWRRRTSVTS